MLAWEGSAVDGMTASLAFQLEAVGTTVAVAAAASVAAVFVAVEACKAFVEETEAEI